MCLAFNAAKHPVSWPDLFRPSTAFFQNEDVDARHKAGHDGGEASANDRVLDRANGDRR
jgi:hypothetical protein